MNILITGGASGLGQAITAVLAADQQNHVYFTYNKSIANAKQIKKDFPNTTSIKCDVRSEGELNSLICGIENFDLDVLVNNAWAGTFLKSHFHKTSSSEFADDFRDNVLPVIEITQAAISSFRKKKQGKIITILTAALADRPPIGSAVYVANKAYLGELSKVWAAENARFSITSNTISPSFMQTSLTAGIDERVVEQIKESHPLKKLLTVDEVAKTVAFLVNASSQINAIDILMNGGANIQ